jgi:alcohol dehydrogenase class IV
MNFMFSMATFVQFGCGVSKQIGATLADSGLKRVFFVYDAGVKAAGLVEAVAGSLKAAGLQYLEYGEVLPNPPDYQVQAAAALAKDFKADVIVALGGGSPMDLAKGVNILLSNPAPINAYNGMNMVRNPVGPLYAIPTTAGTGSEVTAVTVITDTKTVKKMVLFGRYIAPTVALVDPELTLGLSKSLTASTGMDALTHALESYVSVLSSPVTDTLALEAARIIAGSLRQAFKDGGDIQARTDMLLGSMLAAFGFTNTSLGLVHSLAHPMGAHCGVPHGVGNAVMLSHVMEFNTPALPPEKVIRMAQTMGIAVSGKSPEALGKEFAGSLAALASDLGIPRVRDLGVPKDMIPTLANDALQELSTQTTPRKPALEEAVALYEKAW